MNLRGQRRFGLENERLAIQLTHDIKVSRLGRSTSRRVDFDASKPTHDSCINGITNGDAIRLVARY